MSSTIPTAEDTQTLLAELKKLVLDIQKRQVTSEVQQHEIYCMTTAISAKLECIEVFNSQSIPTKPQVTEPEMMQKKMSRITNTSTSVDNVDTSSVIPISTPTPTPTPTLLPVKTISNPIQTDPPKKKGINKMTFFNEMFKKNCNYFNNFITPEDKENIRKVNQEKWNELHGEALSKAIRSSYYEFMKEHYDSDLKDLTASHNKSLEQEVHNLNAAT